MGGQVVQITINVTDGNAAEAVQQVVAQLNALGPAGEAGGAAAAAGLDEIGEHALTSLDNVRLLRDDLGIHIPRAMEKVISQSAMMSGAIAGMGSVLVGLGAVEILTHIGESVYASYEKWILLKDVIASSDAVVKNFGDSAASAMDQAAVAHEKYLRLTQGPQAADQYSLDQYRAKAIAIPQYQSDEFKKLPDAVKQDLEKITGESIMPKDLDGTIAKVKLYQEQLEKVLETERAAKSGVVLGGQYSLPQLRQMAEQQKSIEIAASLLKNLEARQEEYKEHVLGSQAQINDDAKKKDDESIAKAKEKNAEILRLQTEARNSELTGARLMEAEKAEAIASFTEKYKASRDAIDAIEEAYNAKETALWNQQWEEADKAMRAAQQAAQQQAHTGTGSIEFERENAINDVNQKQWNNGLDPDLAQKERDAANVTANTKILAAQVEFEQQLQQISTHGADAQIGGYARIADAADVAIRKIQTDWTAYEDRVRASVDSSVDEEKKKDNAILDANRNMLREMEQLHQKTMEQVAKEEEETARLSLPEWQQAQLRIIDAYQDRVRQIEEAERQQNAALDADMLAHQDRVNADRQAEKMNALDADAQMLAARQLMNAQIQQSDEETRNKLASGLQSLFSHPEQFFEKRAMDTAFQLMANEMLSVFQSSSPVGGILQYMFGMGPQMSTSSNPLNAIESALGMGGHGGNGGMGATNPSMVQFSQGTTQIFGAGQIFTAAVTQFGTAVSSMSLGGGMAGFGGGGTFGGSGFGLLGSTGGASPSVSGGGGGGVDLAALPAGSYDVDMATGSLGSGVTPLQAGAASKGMLGSVAGIAGGALMGATSIYSAYQNSNPVAGAVGGAMGGMETGAAIGSIVPGLGTAVGGAIGAIAGGIGGLLAGIFGDKGRGQAESLDVNTIQPSLAKDMQDYEAGRAGYNTLATELNSMLISAQNSTQSMGSGARDYFNSNISPEIHAVLSSLQKQEIGGRSAITLSAAQYHTGGMIGDFGDLATSDTEGFIHAMRNEFVVNPAAAQAHGPLLNAIQSNNVSYGSMVQPRMPASSAGSGGTVNIQALDSKSVAQWAKAGGGLSLMAALNQANRQYSGVGRG